MIPDLLTCLRKGSMLIRFLAVPDRFGSAPMSGGLDSLAFIVHVAYDSPRSVTFTPYQCTTSPVKVGLMWRC